VASRLQSSGGEDPMKSKAAIGNHPIHPMLAPIPIGAFFIALLGDAMYTASPREDRERAAS